MGAPAELIGLYWTTSGPVEVHFGREWSLFDLRDRCEQAARVGFAGLGLWHADIEHVLETRTLREVRQLFDDNGLRYVELEFLGDWFLDPGDERRTASDARRALLFEAAAALPTHHIKVGNIAGMWSSDAVSCPPASRRSTSTSGSSLSLAASTQPADPAPTIT